MLIGSSRKFCQVKEIKALVGIVFSSICELDFEAFAGAPSIFKHRQKLMVINVHVDDLLVRVRHEEDGQWLLVEPSCQWSSLFVRHGKPKRRSDRQTNGTQCFLSYGKEAASRLTVLGGDCPSKVGVQART